MQSRQQIRSGILLITFFLFPALFYYLSPVLSVTASRAGIVNGSLIVFVLLFFSALILGRAYCGWLCPTAGCQEALFAARSKPVRRGDWIKWIIWLPWILSMGGLATLAGGFRRIDFFYQTHHGISMGDMQAVIVYYLVLFLLIVLPALVFGKRSFCHHLCWMAPFMILGRWIRNRGGWAALQLVSRPQRCQACGTCTQNCPMSLAVMRMAREGVMAHTECILCGRCVDGCAHKVITYAYGRPNSRRAVLTGVRTSADAASGRSCKVSNTHPR